MKRAHTVSLLAALYLVSAIPAHSQDVFSLIQNMAGKYAMTWSDLESRRSQLEVEINSAASTSKITPAQATDFRAEMATITQQISAAKVDGRRLGISQSIALSNKVNVLAGALAGAIENKVASLPDIDALQLQLSTQIDTAVTGGQISAATATTLKAELQQVAAVEEAYKADSGSNLTPRQIELLSGKLTTAKGNIEQQVRIGQSAIPALNDRRTAIEAKIQAAFTTGRISAGEAENLKSDLARIGAQQATFQSATGVLTGTQVYTLAQNLDQVDDRITARMSSTLGTSSGTNPTVSTVDVDRLHEQTTSRINQLAASGRITHIEASVALQDLQQIASLANAYKTSAGGIKPHQVDRLLSDLSGINTRLDTQLATSGNVDGGRTGGIGNGGYRNGGNRNGGNRNGGNRYGGNRYGGNRNQDNATDDSTNDDNLATNNSGATVTTGGGFDVSNLPVINVKNFADVRGYWGEPYVNELASRNVIGGFPNGSFAPNDEITRAQFAAIVIKALNLQPATGGRVFTDVPATNWASGAIAAASNAGLIGGFPDGTFKPGDNITRAQALVILSKALRNANSNSAGLQGYTDKSAVPSWAETNVAQAANAKIIVNFPDASQIRPNALATRGEVAGLMYQTLNSLGANLPQMRIGVNSSEI